MTLNIDNPNIFEKELFDFIKNERDGLKHITVDALKSFLDTSLNDKKLSFKKKNPLKHLSQIEYNDEDKESLDEVKPYENVDDSGKYIHDLRRKRDV